MSSDTLRMIFGFSILLILAGLALAIAMGKVEESTSYGLMPLLVALVTRRPVRSVRIYQRLVR